MSVISRPVNWQTENRKTEIIMHRFFGILEERKSKFNGLIQVVGTMEGPRIVVDGVTQSGGLMKQVWKAGLRKIKQLLPEAPDVLVLGLGGGSAVEVVKKYYPNARITGLEIDAEMVEMGKKYMQLSKIADFEIIIADATIWVEKNSKTVGDKSKRFDLILIDLFCGEEIPRQFYKEKFIGEVRKLLKKNGYIAFNHLYSFLKKNDARILLKTLRKIFSVVITVRPEANVIIIVQRESD